MAEAEQGWTSLQTLAVHVLPARRLPGCSSLGRGLPVRAGKGVLKLLFLLLWILSSASSSFVPPLLHPSSCYCSPSFFSLSFSSFPLSASSSSFPSSCIFFILSVCLRRFICLIDRFIDVDYLPVICFTFSIYNMIDYHSINWK